jgi:hypothetical protein
MKKNQDLTCGMEKKITKRILKFFLTLFHSKFYLNFFVALETLTEIETENFAKKINGIFMLHFKSHTAREYLREKKR